MASSTELWLAMVGHYQELVYFMYQPLGFLFVGLLVFSIVGIVIYAFRNIFK